MQAITSGGLSQGLFDLIKTRSLIRSNVLLIATLSSCHQNFGEIEEVSLHMPV